MSKILQTRLPLAQGQTVSADTFNRLVRVLELNLGAVDVSFSPHYNATEIGENQFATGSIIFNTTNEIHQAFDGTVWRDLYQHQTYPTGVSITSSLGSVTVSTP
jgi:hypothetical protein|tara:strand:+ start:258 stop:569 length:312 start_codon:yes stop_codon:yes gene_type:complete